MNRLPHQHEIDAKIQTTLETMMRCNYACASIVCLSYPVDKSWYTLGFRGASLSDRAGDIIDNKDGTFSKILAIVG